MILWFFVARSCTFAISSLYVIQYKNAEKVPGNNVFALFSGTLARKERFELSLAF